ncbi:MAG: sodium:proton antiporter NhaD [Bacteroidales bacterium]
MIYTLMPIIFLIGILAIAFEEKLHINKAASALLMALLLWGLFVFDSVNILGNHTNVYFEEFLTHNPKIALLPLIDQFHSFIVEDAILKSLGDVSQTLFFVMCVMIIIEMIDSHGGFRAVSSYIKTRNKRKLLWIISLMTFFLAALINNMACAIVVIALLRKLIPDHREDRLTFASMVIIAANAGGSFSPIGDVTTILLWTGGNISALHQITHLFLPGFVSMIVPLSLLTFQFKPNAAWESPSAILEENRQIPQLNTGRRLTILIIGMLSLALVPLFRQLTGLPPFMGVMFGLVLLWIVTDLFYRNIDTIEEKEKLNVSRLTSMIDLPTILFFLGILMSVAALRFAGQLGDISMWIDSKVSSPYIVSFILGVMSSFVDNVALVAGTMGMYPVIEQSGTNAPHLSHFVTDGDFWTFIAYCAVTGGSLLIIGSATGVAVMGMEKITFGYYFKRFSWLATLGYIAGALTYVYISR